jgi:hypothetical protein
MEFVVQEQEQLVELPFGIRNGMVEPSDVLIFQHVVPGPEDCLLPSITWEGPPDTVGMKAVSFTIPYARPDVSVLEGWQVEGVCFLLGVLSKYHFIDVLSDKLDSIPKLHCSVKLKESEGESRREFRIFYSMDIRRLIADFIGERISFRLDVCLDCSKSMVTRQ